MTLRDRTNIRAVREVGSTADEVFKGPNGGHEVAMVGYFDRRRTQAGYRGAIDSDLAPWATLIGRVTAQYDLPEYPQAEFRAALATFADLHGRDANPTTQDDWPEVRELAVAAGGWAE